MSEKEAEAAGNGRLSTRRPKRVKESIVSYFRQISAAFSQSNTDQEHMKLIVGNAICEMEGYEASMASHKLCSAVVESLLSFASEEQFFQIADSFSEFYLHLITNRYGSHVVESLLRRLSSILTHETCGSSTHGVAVSHVLRICEELGESWTFAMSDACGSHCMRGIVSVLSGREIPKKDSLKKRKRKRKKMRVRHGQGDSEAVVACAKDSLSLPEASFEPPASFGRVLDDVLNCVLYDIQQSKDARRADRIWQSSSTSATVQLLLLTEHDQHRSSRAPITSKIVDAILDSRGKDGEEGGETVVRMANHPSGSPLLEALLYVADDALRHRLLSIAFVPNIDVLARDDYGNFAVQRLLSLLTNPADVKIIRKALEPLLPSLLQRSGRAGVLWRLIEACGRAGSETSAGLCARVVDSVSGAESNWLSALLFRGGAATTPFAMECRVVHALLDLPIDECRSVLRAILDLDGRVLETLATHPWGSRHVIEPVLEGPPSFDWARQKLVKTFLAMRDDAVAGHNREAGSLFARLSTNRFGAFCVQKCFEAVQPSDRRRIAKQLVGVRRKLSGDRVGQKVLEACRLTLFADSPKEWMQMQTKRWKRRTERTDAAPAESCAPSNSSVIDALFRSNDSDRESPKKKRKRQEKKKKKKKKKKSRKESSAPSVTTKATDPALKFVLDAIKDSETR